MAPKQERQKKRDLIRWDEDKDTQILLAIQAHTIKRGIKIPWDDIAQEIGPKVTGNAVLQHLAKVKKRRQDNGLPVPEPGNRRKSLKRSASEDSDEHVGGEEGGKSDDSYQGPTPKSVRRRLSKVVKHERSNSGGTPARGRKARTASSTKVAGVSKSPAVKKEEDTSQNFIEKQSDVDDSEDGEEYVAPGQPFLRFDNFEEDSDSDTTPIDEEAGDGNLPVLKEAPELPTPTKVVTLQYKTQEDTKQLQGGQGSQQYQLPPIQTAAEHFESAWNDPWGMPPTGQFNPVHFDPSPMSRTYGFGHPAQMMPSLSFPPTYAPHGNYPHVMDHRMRYGHGSRDTALPSQFTPVNMPTMSFGTAGGNHQQLPQSQTLPQMTWSREEDAPERNNSNSHRAAEEPKPMHNVIGDGVREGSSELFNRRPSSISSSAPNFDDIDI